MKFFKRNGTPMPKHVVEMAATIKETGNEMSRREFNRRGGSKKSCPIVDTRRPLVDSVYGQTQRLRSPAVMHRRCTLSGRR